MNWQTEKIINEAKDSVDNEGVFSPDQITLLHRMIERLGAAIDKESSCSGGSQSGGHGFA